MKSDQALEFMDLFDMDRLQELQDAFAELTGTASIITDTRGIAITRPSNFARLCSEIIKGTEQGRRNCERSDLKTEAAIGSPEAGGPVITECLSAGLWDAGAGIYVGDTHIGNWLVGQVRNIETEDHHFREYARKIGADEKEFMEALSEVTTMSRERFGLICRTLYLMTGQLSELANQNHALKLEMESRIAAEEQNRVVEAQMLNAQKLESLGVLAGGIAHDFNNLLMVILGNAELAIGSLPEDGSSPEHLVEIKKVARQAADLCNQMLAYAGRGKFVIEVIHLNSLISDMKHILQMSVSKNVTLSYRLIEDCPQIRGDPGQLKQVLLNLVVNVSEAIGDNGGMIEIETGIADRREVLNTGTLFGFLPEGENYLCLKVTDNGCGMEEATLNRIFDPFFSTKLTGRGLGMAAVLGIMKAHRSAINVSSSPGSGSSFSFFLPFHEAHEKGSTNIRSGDAQGRGARTGTVLLVDDEEGIRQVAGKMLECIGFTVLTAADGQKAVSILKAGTDPVDCVLLDLTMPGLSGAETCSEIRKLDPDLKIVISSGFDEKDASRQVPREYISGFIQKPYGLAALDQKLREILG
ncbi:MAG: PocR ligand-binding domain-containing protein [Candidatus Fermentibacteraceae bacterium]|nr:PocR ligand-binding domain-containing protein [Candidatus Fermentibacteraceae bacterium]MBN2608552.1 PocR ligand-binding domain-containing protein [Candidatus Fermentibacteraceae bacterium]